MMPVYQAHTVPERYRATIIEHQAISHIKAIGT